MKVKKIKEAKGIKISGKFLLVETTGMCTGCAFYNNGTCLCALLGFEPECSGKIYKEE
jgi:hypothetical protein